MPNYHRTSTHRAEDWARFDRAMKATMDAIMFSYVQYGRHRDSLEALEAHMYRCRNGSYHVSCLREQEPVMFEADRLIERAENTIKTVRHVHFPNRYRWICSPGEIRAYASTGARVRYEDEIDHARGDIARADELLRRCYERTREFTGSFVNA